MTLTNIKEMNEAFKSKMRMQQEPAKELSVILELIKNFNSDAQATLGDN